MAAQLHLKGEALALLYRHRARKGRRLTEQVARQILFVAGVPGFVTGAHQAAEESAFVEPGGSKDINQSPGARCEQMRHNAQRCISDRRKTPTSETTYSIKR